MHTDDFNSIVENQINVCRATLIEKADEYATEDRLHNFRVAAKLQGTDPVRALSGMMAKHTISIYDMCEDAGSHPVEVWSEKITDHINYLLLLKAILSERPKEIGGLPTSPPIAVTREELGMEPLPEKVVYREHGKDYIRASPNVFGG